MLPGPTLIRRCSDCGKLIAQDTIASGNTFGAHFWTDGKVDAPMLPDQPWLVKCRHCGALLWIDEQEQVGEKDPWESGDLDPDKFRDARECETPAASDYRANLAEGISDQRKERYLRLRAWWAGNDPRRGEAPAGPLSDAEIANLRAFLPLLNESDENDRIMKAEVLRELGRFEDAVALLAGPFDEEHSRAAAVIRDLAGRQISSVSEMQFG